MATIAKGYANPFQVYLQWLSPKLETVNVTKCSVKKFTWTLESCRNTFTGTRTAALLINSARARGKHGTSTTAS